LILTPGVKLQIFESTPWRNLDFSNLRPGVKCVQKNMVFSFLRQGVKRVVCISDPVHLSGHYGSFYQEKKIKILCANQLNQKKTHKNEKFFLSVLYFFIIKIYQSLTRAFPIFFGAPLFSLFTNCRLDFRKSFLAASKLLQHLWFI
jgi:hypothetical protein